MKTLYITFKSPVGTISPGQPVPNADTKAGAAAAESHQTRLTSPRPPLHRHRQARSAFHSTREIRPRRRAGAALVRPKLLTLTQIHKSAEPDSSKVSSEGGR